LAENTLTLKRWKAFKFVERLDLSKKRLELALTALATKQINVLNQLGQLNLTKQNKLQQAFCFIF
jgi:hypothetical protein